MSAFATEQTDNSIVIGYPFRGAHKMLLANTQARFIQQTTTFTNILITVMGKTLIEFTHYLLNKIRN